MLYAGKVLYNKKKNWIKLDIPKNTGDTLNKQVSYLLIVKEAR